MAHERISLALAYLKAHPEAAAATLENHDVAEVGDFLVAIPPSSAGTVVQQMLPHFASRVFSLLPPERATAIFSTLTIASMTAILRYWKKTTRQALLKELPAKMQVACSLLLTYSEDLVGAWVTPQVAMVAQETPVRDALKQLKSIPDLVSTDMLFTISRDRELKGRLPTLQLLTANPDAPVSNLAQAAGATLTARMRLSQAAVHPAWKKVHEIPVLNRNQKLIGALRLADLRRALESQTGSDSNPPGPAAAEGIARAYGETLLASLASLKTIIESELHS